MKAKHYQNTRRSGRKLSKGLCLSRAFFNNSLQRSSLETLVSAQKTHSESWIMHEKKNTLFFLKGWERHTVEMKKRKLLNLFLPSRRSAARPALRLIKRVGATVTRRRCLSRRAGTYGKKAGCLFKLAIPKPISRWDSGRSRGSVQKPSNPSTEPRKNITQTGLWRWTPPAPSPSPPHSLPHHTSSVRSATPVYISPSTRECVPTSSECMWRPPKQPTQGTDLARQLSPSAFDAT